MAVEAKFDEVLRVLSRKKVEFIVVGGIAAILQGSPLSTEDIDWVYLSSEKNLSLLATVLRELEARSAVQRRGVRGESSRSRDGHRDQGARRSAKGPSPTALLEATPHRDPTSGHWVVLSSRRALPPKTESAPPRWAGSIHPAVRHQARCGQAPATVRVLTGGSLVPTSFWPVTDRRLERLSGR